MPNYLSKIKPNGANGEEYKFKDEEVREAVINVQTNITGTKSLTGDIISVSDAAPILAENVTSAIDPIQDLHGYDYPWVGGAGKNLIPMTVDGIKAANTNGTWSGNVYTIGSVTFEVLVDSNNNVIGIKVNAPSAHNTQALKISSFTRVSGTTYILNGCPTNGSANSYKLRWNDVGYDYGSGITTDGTSGTGDVAIDITSNVEVTNLVFYPMIRLSTETDPTFAPYSNICPIQGHDMCEVVRCGKNLYDPSTLVTANYNINVQGEVVASDYWSISDYVSVEPSKAYAVSATTNNPYDIHVAIYDANKTFIERKDATGGATTGRIGGTFTTGSDAAYIIICLPKNGSGSTAGFSVCQLEIGSTATTYEPYTGQTYPIQIGNKNQLQLDLDTIKSFNTDGVWSGNTYALNGVELTVVTDDDGLVTEIKAVSQGSVSNDVIFKIASITYKADVEYILNGCPTGGSSNEYAIWSFDIGSEDVDIDEGDGVEIEKSSDTAASVCIRIRYLYGASNLSFKPMLRFASITNPDFSPYNPLFAQQGMCFGGELDVTNGVLVVDRAYADLGSLNWLYDTSSAKFYTLDLSTKIFKPGDSNLAKVICSMYRYVRYIDFANNTVCIGSPSGRIYIKDSRFTDTSTFKTAVTGQTICYELATPIIYHLTPTEIQMLLEYNNLWSNTGDLTVKYQPNNVIGEVKGEIDELKEYVDATFLPKSKSKGIIYGMHIDGTESDPDAKITYLADAVGMTPAYMDFTKGEFNYGSWGDAFFMPRPCMLRSNGFVDYYLKPTDLTKKLDETASDVANTSYDGNAMMEWGQLDGSRIWLKIVPDANKIGASVYIADHRADPDFHDWAFHNYKSQSSDFFYTPIYNGSKISDKLRSLSGQQVSNNLNATQERTAAQLNNPTDTPIWDIETFADITLINFLAILITKSTNGQAKFGQGLSSDGSEALNNGFRTGVHDDKGLFYGTNSGTISSTTYGNAVKIFGMENWWGFQWRRYIGHVMVNGVQKAKLTYGQEDGSTTTGYNLTGDGYKTENSTAPTGTFGSYIKSFLYTEDGLFLKDVSGSSTTYYEDGGWFNNSITAVPLRGVPSNFGALCGPFAVAISSTASLAIWYIGASLSCHPTT